MAKELGPRRIAVAPGAVVTDLSGGIVRDNPEVNRHSGEMRALGRTGVPDRVAASRGQRLGVVQRIEISGGLAI